jgi:aminoglycoside phosphotransferase family enzyme
MGIQTRKSFNTTNKSAINFQSHEDVLDEKSRKEKFDEIRRKFQYFLRKSEIQSCLIEHRSAMYDLLTSHGDLDDLILFAEHVQDYERVILLYLERADYEKALTTLEPLVCLLLFVLFSKFLFISG